MKCNPALPEGRAEGPARAPGRSLEAPVRAGGGILGRRLPALDGLRGLAVLLVMAYHFVGVLDGSRLGSPLPGRLSSFGWVGVEIFFVLSGFLITSILLEAKGSSRYFRSFYVRRVLRIFPLYYAVLAIVAGSSAALYFMTGRAPISVPRQFWLWVCCSNIPMMRGGAGFVSAHFSLNHFWSLAIEEHFYLVWPLVVYKCSAGRLPRVALMVMVAAAVLRVLLLPLVGPRGVYHFTLCRVDGLAFGAWLACWFREGGPRGFQLDVARWMLPGSLACLAGLAFWRNGLNPYDPAAQVFGYSLVALASGGVLIEAVWGGPSGLVQRALTVRGLRFLGFYSYGIYVFHGLLRPSFASMIPYLDGWTGSYVLASGLYLGASVGCSVALAVASYHLYESPFLRLKSHFGYGR